MRTTLVGEMPTSSRQAETPVDDGSTIPVRLHTSTVCPLFSIPVWAALVWVSTTARICALEAEVLGTFGVRIPRKTRKNTMERTAGTRNILLENEFSNAFMRTKSIPKTWQLASNFFVYKQADNRRF